MRQRLAVHRTIVVVDVERFGDPARTSLDQLAVREALYLSLQQAFAESGLDWGGCVCEDRGDGALILVPSDVPKALLAADLPVRLTAAVDAHNARCGLPERMRLRMALHAGEVYQDAHGVAGAAVNHAFRLIEATELRTVLATSTGVLALIVSDWFFDEVARHDPAAKPSSYRRVQIAVKETIAAGWIRVLGPDAIPPTGSQGKKVTRHDAVMAVADNRTPTGSAIVISPDTEPVIADIGIIDRWHAPAQLPHDAVGFTGREPEFASLASMAAAQDGAAVVITAIDGVAGIGKTALAIRFAHRAAPAFPDGQLFVNLRGFDPEHPPLDPAVVLARFVRALGAGPSQLPADPDELAGMYRSQLSGRRVLIVLDNAVSAEQVRPLLPGMAGCLAIVTSRSTLSGLAAVDGAQRLTLGMLPLRDAVALLARAAGDERAAADPAATRRLAELCGRLPLALRITADRAAAHPHLSIADLAEELAAERDRLDVLATDEQVSQVRAVFSWSYRALTPASARAFRLLSLHPGQDLSTTAAAALLDAPVPETRQLLRTLASGHLLEETGRDRYQFHDLVRVYAAECTLAAESHAQQAAAMQRLLTWYLRMANACVRTLSPHQAHVPLDLPPVCQPPGFANEGQAMRWAESESANLVSVADQAASVGDNSLAWKLPATTTRVLDLGLGSKAGTLPSLRSALAISQELGDRAAEVWVLTGLGLAYLDAGQPDRAADCCRRAYVISVEAGHIYGQWLAPYLEGLAYLALGRLTDATSCLQQSLATARRACDLRAEGMSLTWLGAVHERLGSFETAISLREQAVTALAQASNRWQYAYAVQKLAEARHHHGRPGDAIDNYKQARALFRQIGDRRTEADILLQLGNSQETTGQADAARQSWQQALVIFEELWDPRADQVRTRLEPRHPENH